MLELAFFQPQDEDLSYLQKAIKQKEDFLTNFPNSSRLAEIKIMLAIENRDMARIKGKNNRAEALESYTRAKNFALEVIRENTNSEKASTSEQLLKIIEEEMLSFLY